MRVAERFELGAGGAGPGRQCRAGRVHARARVDRLLAVVGNVVNEAADQDMRDQAGCRHALVDQLRVDRRLAQRLAALARPLATDVAMDEELRRNDVQALAYVLADAHHRAAALRRRAGRALGLVAMLDSAQVLGKGLPARLALCSLLAGWRRRCLGVAQSVDARLQSRLVLGQRLLEQAPLVGGHRFRLGAELQAFQPGELEGQLLELRGREPDLRVALGDLTAVRGVDRRHAIEQQRGDAGGGLGIETLEVFSLEVTHIEHGHPLWAGSVARARARNGSLPLQRLHACDDLRLRQPLPRQPENERVKLLLRQRERRAACASAVAGLRP